MEANDNISDADKEIIYNCGALGFDWEEMSQLLEMEISDSNINEVQAMYNKGVLVAKYVIQSKLLQLARNGDINALGKLEQVFAKKDRVSFDL